MSLLRKAINILGKARRLQIIGVAEGRGGFRFFSGTGKCSTLVALNKDLHEASDARSQMKKIKSLKEKVSSMTVTPIQRRHLIHWLSFDKTSSGAIKLDRKGCIVGNAVLGSTRGTYG
jgi:hypothetical protein